MTYAGVTYGDLYNGNMRFDVNISLAPAGAKELGTRAEIKNLNSFRSVERAVEYEYQRQSKLLDKGEKIKQETRGWSDDTGKTTAQRSKEEAQDYRYMPEPDVPPIHLSDKYISAEKAALPLLPSDYRARFRDIIPTDTLEILLDYQPLMEKLSELKDNIKAIANLFTSVLLAEEKSVEMLDDLPSAEQLSNLAEMNAKKELSSTATKEVFLKFFDPQMKSKSALDIAKELGVLQENDTAALEKIVDTVLAKPETQKAQADFKAGQDKVIGFLVGQVMKESHGQANPSTVQQILRQKLK